MDLEHFEMIGGMIVLTVVIVLAIQFQVSQMEGLSDVSGDWILGEGSKSAASFHVVSREDVLGKVSEGYMDSITGDSRDGCNTDIPGLRSGDRFSFIWQKKDGCGSLSDQITKVKIPVYVEKTGGEDEIDYLKVGG